MKNQLLPKNILQFLRIRKFSQQSLNHVSLGWRVKACFDMKKQAFSLHCTPNSASIPKEPIKFVLLDRLEYTQMVFIIKTRRTGWKPIPHGKQF